MSKKIIPTSGELPGKAITRTDEQLYKPGKFEITKDEDFKINIYIKLKDKRWILVDNENIADEKHWVVFKMWSYEEEIELRKKATIYDSNKRIHFVDHDQLNRLKIQKLMKAWSFEVDNPRLKIIHINEVMVDESFKAVMNLHPNILRYIVEAMNNVLDGQ